MTIWEAELQLTNTDAEAARDERVDYRRDMRVGRMGEEMTRAEAERDAWELGEWR